MLHPGRCLRAASRSIGRRHLIVRTSWLSNQDGEILCAGEKVEVVLVAFTGWSRNGLARWSTRKGKNQFGGCGWRGRVAPRRLTMVGVGRKCGTAEAGSGVNDAQQSCKCSRWNEPCLWFEVAVVVEACGRRAESRVGERALFERGKWCGQIVRVQVVAGSGQLKRLEEISDGNVDCFVEAVVLIFVPFEAWVGGRNA